MKVVINGTYGGFSVSETGTRWMAEQGDQSAIDFLNKWEESKCAWWGFRPEDRANPILVRAVEKLGKEANGTYANLRVVEIPDDVEWQVEEYDGLEWVAEKHRRWS